MQKIVTYLWYDKEAEEAAKLYTSIFKNSWIRSTMRDESGLATEKGKVLIVEFQLEGQDFIALNGGPQFKFNESPGRAQRATAAMLKMRKIDISTLERAADAA